MNTIYHDPTRGWLLLTEKWPEKPEPFNHESGGVCPVCRYERDLDSCLSTAIEIPKDYWNALHKIIFGNPWTLEHKVLDHHPYSVEAEFEVKEQWRRKGADTTRENSNQWEDFTPPTATKQSFNEYRKIARLVKAKEVDPSKVIVKPPVMIYEHKSKPEPTETQDELWDELNDECCLGMDDDYTLDVEEAKKRFRIERI